LCKIATKYIKNRLNGVKISLVREVGGYKAGKRKSFEARRQGGEPATVTADKKSAFRGNG
jgi:hypothetical protein